MRAEKNQCYVVTFMYLLYVDTIQKIPNIYNLLLGAITNVGYMLVGFARLYIVYRVEVFAAQHCSGSLAMTSPTITTFKCTIVSPALCWYDTAASNTPTTDSQSCRPSKAVLLQHSEGRTQPITGVPQSLPLRDMMAQSVCVRLAKASVRYPGPPCTEYFFAVYQSEGCSLPCRNKVGCHKVRGSCVAIQSLPKFQGVFRRTDLKPIVRPLHGCQTG